AGSSPSPCSGSSRPRCGAPGCAWNGCVHRSLSQVAKAITGTNWNGHRFFGLKAVRNGAFNRKSSTTQRPNPLLDIGMSPTHAAFAPATPDIGQVAAGATPRGSPAETGASLSFVAPGDRRVSAQSGSLVCCRRFVYREAQRTWSRVTQRVGLVLRIWYPHVKDPNSRDPAMSAKQLWSRTTKYLLQSASFNADFWNFYVTMLGATLPGDIPNIVSVLVEDEGRVGFGDPPGALFDLMLELVPSPASVAEGDEDLS